MEKEIEILKKAYAYFRRAIQAPTVRKPRQLMESFGFDVNYINVGYNSAQIHHRQPVEFIKQLESVGLLLDTEHLSKSGANGYKIFGGYSVVFPLVNRQDEVVNLFALPIDKGEGVFLNNDGFYPCAPNGNTDKLIIASNPLEVALLKQFSELKDFEIISLVNGKFESSFGGSRWL